MLSMSTTSLLLVIFLVQFQSIPAQDLECEDPVQCAGTLREVACINGFCAPRSPVGGPCDRVGSLSGISDCLDAAPDGAKLDCLRGECVRTNIVPLGGACKDPMQCEGESSMVACINDECALRSPVDGPCDRVGSVSGIPDCQPEAPDGAKLDCLRGVCVRTGVVPVGGTCIDPMQCEGKLSEVACINEKCAPRSRLGGPCDRVGSVAGFSDCLNQDDGVELVCLSGRCVNKGVVPVPSRSSAPRDSFSPRPLPSAGSSESPQPVQSSAVNPTRTPQVLNEIPASTPEEGDSNLKIILPSVIGGIGAIVAAAVGAWIAKGRKKDPSPNPDINVTTQQNTIIQVSPPTATE